MQLAVVVSARHGHRGRSVARVLPRGRWFQGGGGGVVVGEQRGDVLGNGQLGVAVLPGRGPPVPRVLPGPAGLLGVVVGEQGAHVLGDAQLGVAALPRGRRRGAVVPAAMGRVCHRHVHI